MIFRSTEKRTNTANPILLAGFLTLAVLIAGSNGQGRSPASQGFPEVRETRDRDDILETYPAYLNFVLEVGQSVNPRYAKRLKGTYEELRRRDPEGAARFLKGLRYELVNKLQVKRLSPARVTTRSGYMRQWVKRYLPLWQREADEHLFRWRSSAVARRAAE